MSELNGYVKLYRCLLDNPIACKDAEHFAVWCYLLLKATHKEYDAVFGGKRITLKRGQLITGRKKIASKLSVSESKVQRILKSFENEQQIEQQMDSRNRLISIVKWELYQQSEQQIEQQVNSKRTASEQLVNTNKNVKKIKNDKNDKKDIYKEIPAELHEPLEAFIEMRKTIKSKLTDRALEMLLKKLNELSNGDIQTSIDILNQSTMNCWKSIYELKQDKPKSSSVSFLDL